MTILRKTNSMLSRIATKYFHRKPQEMSPLSKQWSEANIEGRSWLGPTPVKAGFGTPKSRAEMQQATANQILQAKHPPSQPSDIQFAFLLPSKEEMAQRLEKSVPTRYKLPKKSRLALLLKKLAGGKWKLL